MSGEIRGEELFGMLDALPVEISFIDREDNVKYFNKNGDRIFPRSKEVIGKNIRNCHPKKSLDKVEAILEGFKKGNLEKAEFWINIEEKKILIKYFPVKNENKDYLGCLEVTQDITEIKKIEGEKRLL